MSQLKLSDPLQLGLFNPTSTGNGFDSLELIVHNDHDGSVVLDQTFSTLAAADAYFNGHVLSLGTLGALSGNGATASFDVALYLTATTPNDGFNSQMILALGVPEPNALVLSAFALAAAMAGYLWSRRRIGSIQCAA